MTHAGSLQPVQVSLLMGNPAFIQSVRALRYTVAFSFVVALVSGTTSVYLTHKLREGNERLAEIASATGDGAKLYAAGLQMCQATRNILLDPANPAAHRNHAAAAKEFDLTLSSLRRRLEVLFPGDGVVRACDSIRADFAQHLMVQRKIHELSQGGEFARAKADLNSIDTPLWRKYKQTMQESGEWMDGKAREVSKEIGRGYGMAQTLSWLCGVILVAAGLGALLMSGWVARRLRDLAASLSAGAGQIARAAEQVSRSSQSLAGGAATQAASIEETAASAGEVNSMAGRNGENSQAAAALVTNSQAQLAAVVQSLDQTVAAISALDQSSGQISRIIKVIDEIAFQTNILALNAAVEAARAGEAGMGFGVVAGEVGNLAQRCAQAARETTALIETSVAQSHDGKAKVDQVARAIKKLTAGSSRLQALVREVSEGTRQQSDGLAQIAKAVKDMDRSTQTTAESAREGAAAAAELDGQARGLREMVASLESAVSGR